MKESKFIAQNKQNWRDFENDLRSKKNKATHINKLFIQVTDDLSYSRTFYKNRLVRVYLNGLAQKLFNGLYNAKKTKNTGFLNFWKYELPIKMYEARREFLVSFLIFVGAVVIGIISSKYDKDFTRVVLGDRYVNMTLENIEKNDPMAVYKDQNQVGMFLGITINNLYVSLITFLFGLLFSVGSIFNLIYNGIMLGSFQYFFVERNLFRESFLTVWQHGTLEISCIIIAGAAGIVLGKGLLFPGTFTRTESFKLSAIKGMKIFAGIAPIIVMAAFIEGFFTRYTQIGTFPRVIVILLSLSFIIFYFVIYPRWLYPRIESKNVEIKAEKLTVKEPFKSDFTKVLSSEEILGNTIQLFNTLKLKIGFIIIFIGLFHSLSVVILEIIDNKGNLPVYYDYFDLSSAKVHYLLGFFELIFVQLFFGNYIKKQTDSRNSDKRAINFSTVISVVFISFLAIVLFYIMKWWTVFAMVVILPYLFFVSYFSFTENILFFKAFPKANNFLKGSFWKFYWGSLKQSLLFGFLFLILNSAMIWQYFLQNIFTSFSYNQSIAVYSRMFMVNFMIFSLFGIYFIFQFCTSVYSYYAFNEIATAKSLFERIERMGKRNSIFGFEKE